MGLEDRPEENIELSNRIKSLEYKLRQKEMDNQKWRERESFHWSKWEFNLSSCRG